MAKPKQIFVDYNEFSAVIARVSSLKAPLTLEAVTEVQHNLPEVERAEAVASFVGLPQGQYAQGICGVYPDSRMLRRATLENPTKARDPAFLPQYLTNQFKVDLQKDAISVLNANGGAPFDPERQLAKEIFFCGAPRAEISKIQERLVASLMYPTRVEIGSVATVGGVMHHMKLNGESMPTLILEIGASTAHVLICNGSNLDVARPIPFGFSSMYPVVQKELGLKDEASARKLFTSSTFDFTEMGGLLLKKLLKELQASTGFYEVQTGMTVGSIYVGNLPQNLSWIPTTLSRTLGVEILKPNYSKWLESMDITLGEAVEPANLNPSWMGLFSLICQYKAEGAK